MSLQEELINSFGDGFNKRAEEYLNSSFLNNRSSWTTSIINDYMRHGVDPNESISKLASDQGLNDEQIQRIIEDVNVGIYLQKYAQTKGKNVRRVIFPIADPDKIKQRGAISDVDVTAEEEFGSMKKIASGTMSFDAPEQFGDFLTSTGSYEPSLWEPGAPEKTAKEYTVRKIESRIELVKKAKAQEIKEFLQKIAYIGDALIYHERCGKKAQDLLDKIAQDADFTGYAQLPVINYIHEKIASLKEQSKLPKNFNLEIRPTEKAVDNFSLGKHSLMKEANGDIIIQVKELPFGTDYKGILDVANKIRDELEKKPSVSAKKPIVMEGV